MRFTRWHTGLVVALALVIALTLASCGEDDEDKGRDGDAGALTVTNAWVRASLPVDAADDGGTGDEGVAGPVTGAFMVIENTTDTAERLVSVAVAADIARVVEIHETTMGANDTMQMRPVEGVDVPANGSVELKPGSYHVMLVDVQRTLNPGDTVTLTLTFESGKTLTVEANVREMSG